MRILVITVFLAINIFNFSSMYASETTTSNNLDCSNITDTISGSYPSYKIKVDNLFSVILSKDIDIQKKYYSSLNTKINTYLTEIDKIKQKKLYTILGYISCENDDKLLDNSTNNSKDLGNNFTLKQTLEQSNLEYNGKVVKTWSHYSEKNPFIDTEGCEKLTKIILDNKFDYRNREDSWEMLNEVEKKECIKEYNFKWIEIKETNNKQFYTINKAGYEWVTMNLFDVKNGIVVNGDFLDGIVKITAGESGIYIQYVGFRGGGGGLSLLDPNGLVIELFKNYEADSIEIKDFELLINNQVKVFYTESGQVKKEKIIDINNIKAEGKILKDYGNGLVIRGNGNKALLYKNEIFLYEGYISDLVPAGSSELITSIAQVEEGESGIYVLISGHNGPSELLYFDKNGNNKKVLKEGFADVIGRMDKKWISSFELMTNKRIKLFYGDKTSEIINL